MKCDYCKYAPPIGYEGDQDECYHFEKQGTVWKDGSYGCTCHPATLEKEQRQYDEYLGRMGTEMGLEMDLEHYGYDLEKIIDGCKHMIGLDRGSKIYHRHGKAFYKAYRNYYCGKREDFELLCKKVFEIMTKRESEKYTYYYLTEYGLDWLSRKLNIVIKEAD